MRKFSILLLAFSTCQAAELNEIDALAFGFSRHFNRSSDYEYRQVNPGLGVGYWRTLDGNRWLALGGVVARFQNSYDQKSRLYSVGARWTIGDRNGLHAGATCGLALLSGYSPDAVIVPVASWFAGWDRFHIEAAYCPTSAQTRETDTASALAVWARVTVIRF